MNSSISVKIGQDEREIFMSYGLLTTLASVVPSIDQVPIIYNDPANLDVFLNTLLAVRDIKGKVIHDGSEFTPQLSLDDVERLLEWGQDHLLDFFTRRALKGKEQAQRVTALLGAPSPNGIQD